MRILFFKASRQLDKEEGDEPSSDKMRRILESHVDEAETDEDRERAEKALQKFTGSAS